MKTKGIIRVIIAITIIATVLFELIVLNKEYIRPAVSDPGFLLILTGCFPSFIAAYLISLVAVSAVLIKKPKNGRRIVYIVSLWIFAMLIIDELTRGWGASTHFDKFDIVASGLGSLLAVVTYEIALRIQNRKNQNPESGLPYIGRS